MRAYILIFTLLAAMNLQGADSATITIDPATKYQAMTGWEATAWAGQDSEQFPNYKDKLYDLVVNDLGINRLRLEIRSGSENTDDNWKAYKAGGIDYPTWRSRRYATVNDNADPFVINEAGYHFSELDDTIQRVVIPIKQRIEARGEKLFINLNYVAFTSQIGSGLAYIHDNADEYAEFMLAAFLHMKKKYGWIPDALEVLLEPDNVSQWNGTTLGRAIVATAARLDSNGFKPRFIAPSNTNMGNAVRYFDALIQVPGALEHLDEFCYHRYGGVSDANLQAIASRAVQHNLKTCMLEWWNNKNTYEVLYKDLTMGRNSSWQQAVVIGYYDVNKSDPANPVITLKSAAKFTRQFFKFIRYGATRIKAESSTFAPLAFINTNGGYVVVVKASGGGTFSIKGLPASTYGIKYTTSSEYDVDLSDQAIKPGDALATAIPARGVITIYAKHSQEAENVPFMRGDANTNGTLDISDAVYSLDYIFSDGIEPVCLDAADTNDDSAIDISDAVYLLYYLFGACEALPAPFAQCGIDPTVDALPCREFPSCKA